MAKRTTPLTTLVTKVWEIKDISELLEGEDWDLGEENGIAFDAGHKIGIPASWRFYFSDSGDGWVGGFLRLREGSAADFVKAGYSLTASVGGKTILFMDFLHLHEFTLPGSWGNPSLFTKEGILEATENGRKALKVTIRLKVFSNGALSMNMNMNMNPRLLKAEEVLKDFKALLESGDGADLEITVPKEAGGEVDKDSYTKKVHKAILMGRSTVFSKMFAKESEMVEAQTGKVVIKDLSPQGLGVFLRYMYTGEVLKSWLQVPSEVINTAEKYGLKGLKHHCDRNLIKAVSVSAGNALAIYEVAKLHNLSAAKRAIAKFVSKNARAVLDGGLDLDHGHGHDGDGDLDLDEEAEEQSQEEDGEDD